LWRTTRPGRPALGACIEGAADPAVAKVLVSVGLEPEPWMVDRVRGELAVWLHALREAAGAGCTAATIAPTPATVPFYEALGLVLERDPPDRTYRTPLD
jgi:hypothetical protein